MPGESASDRVLRFPDRTWDELEGLPQPLRNAAHKVIFHLLEEPVPALADPFLRQTRFQVPIVSIFRRMA
jgi:hypothetical protein